MTTALFLLGMYFIPTVVALARNDGQAKKVPNIGPLIVVNVFLGWTFVGWVAALAMACMTKRPTTVAIQPVYYQQLPPPPNNDGEVSP